MKREEIIRDLVERSSGAGAGQYMSIRCDVAREIVALLKEQEARVLEYSEIEKHSLVWLEDNDKEYVIPALFLQYDGWNAEFSVHAPDKYGDKIFQFATVITFEKMYGITWRCWTSRPTPEQMRDTPWGGEKDAE